MDFTKDFFNLVLDFGDEWVITGIEADHKKLRVYLDLEYISDHYVPKPCNRSGQCFNQQF